MQIIPVNLGPYSMAPFMMSNKIALFLLTLLFASLGYSQTVSSHTVPVAGPIDSPANAAFFSPERFPNGIPDGGINGGGGGSSLDGEDFSFSYRGTIKDGVYYPSRFNVSTILGLFFTWWATALALMLSVAGLFLGVKYFVAAMVVISFWFFYIGAGYGVYYVFFTPIALIGAMMLRKKKINLALSVLVLAWVPMLYTQYTIREARAESNSQLDIMYQEHSDFLRERVEAVAAVTALNLSGEERTQRMQQAMEEVYERWGIERGSNDRPIRPQ